MGILKKIILLCCFLCGMVFAGGARAYDCVIYEPGRAKIDKSLIYLFFGEDKYTPVSNECDASNGKGFDDVKTYLKGIWDKGNVAGFYVLGSASRTGQAAYNSELAGKRAEYVTTNMLPANSVYYWSLGESHATVLGQTDDTTRYNDRYAVIIVVWKQHTCTAETVGLLEKIRQMGKDVSECTDVMNYCKNGTQSKDVLFEDKLNKLHECASKLNIDVDFDSWYRVDTAYNNLSALLAGLSVWKNADGGFNTSRLLSDSIAAVVLGTTSGVITSKLVKKSQIKKGFESLQCTIGGQHIADWGDSFMVGMTNR